MNNIIKLNFKFHKLQRDVFDFIQDSDKTIFSLAIGRQWGKSVLCKSNSLYYSMCLGHRVMWVSVSNRSAKFHWTDLLRAVEPLPDNKISKSDRDIEFSSGGSLSVRSSINAASLRGEPLDLIICDEAAHYQDGHETFWEALYPSIIAAKGKCILATTPNGKNWFYDIHSEGDNPNNEYDIVSFNYKSESSPIVDMKRVMIAKYFMSPIKWRQEFNAEFIGSALSVFNNLDTIDESTFAEAPRAAKSYVAGLDVGLAGDNTCISVIDVDNREQVAGYIIDEYEPNLIVDKVVEILDFWKPERTVLETNGVGKPMLSMIKNVISRGVDIKDLEDVYGFGFRKEGYNHKIVGKHISNQVKTNMVEELVAGLQNKQLGILDSSTEYGKLQRREMESYESKLSTSENFRLYGAKSGKHDDTVAALYLSYYLLPRIKVKLKESELVNPFQVYNA